MTVSFITGNNHKFDEIAMIVPNIKQVELDLVEVQSLDPRAIIQHKLNEAVKHGTVPCIIEDTSLSCPALGGLPGPLIKWFLDAVGSDGLAQLVQQAGDTRATVLTIIGYSDGKQVRFFEGEVHGTLVAPRGTLRFGWNDIFVPDGHTKTFAEMTREEKNEISMRGIAAKKLREFLHV